MDLYQRAWEIVCPEPDLPSSRGGGPGRRAVASGAPSWAEAETDLLWGALARLDLALEHAFGAAARCGPGALDQVVELAAELAQQRAGVAAGNPGA